MGRWVLGARPRTLPASVSPVLVGTAVAAGDGRFVAWRFGAALAVALALQVGVNYANDYQDGVRGTDSDRVGPARLVASGLASAAAVRRAAMASLAVAAVAGGALALAVSPWLALLGAACIAAAWAYTGGPRPYGYVGLGELFVFVFFGVVAVAGSAFVQEGRPSLLALGASVPVGLLAVALLLVNNLRDRSRDERAGKRTLAVRLGDAGTRRLYAALLAVAALCTVGVAVLRPWAGVALAAAVLALPPLRRVLGGSQGVDLVPALAATGRLQLVFGLALAAGIWAR